MRLEFDPIPVSRWNSAPRKRQFLCDEPCCVLRRVAGIGQQVTTEDELQDALTQPDVFFWESV